MKLLLVLLCLGCTIVAGAQANGDSVKYDYTKLPGWDPSWDINDPNCPCHEIQRQADKEYKELLEKEKRTAEKRNNDSGKEQVAVIDEEKNKRAGEDEAGDQAGINQNAGGSAASSNERSRSNRKGLKKFFYNTGKSINKMMPKRKKRNKHIDDCWH